MKLLFFLLLAFAFMQSCASSIGPSIVYISTDTGEPVIHRIDVESGTNTQFSFSGEENTDEVDDITWSSSGQFLAFTLGHSLVVFDVESEIFTELPIENHVDKIDEVRYVTWSPSGRFLAFSTVSSLIVLDRGGREITTFSSERIDIIQNLEWAPDEAFIAFHGANSGSRDIFLLNIEDGSLQPLLTKPAINEVCPIFSPDGSKLLFSEGLQGEGKLKMFDFETEEVLDLDFSQSATAFSCPGPISWSNDGNRIALSGYTHVKIVDVHNPNQIGTVIECAQGSYWSVDSQKILYPHLCDHSWNVDFDAVDFDLFVFDSGTGQASQLTNTPDIDEFSPSWSPDGNTIAFISRNDGESNRDIYVMEKGGSEPERLTVGENIWFYHWLP